MAKIPPLVTNCTEVSQMFQGSPHINLDAKGRMAIPSRFKAALVELCAGELTITRHPDGCALLYPRDLWEIKKKQLMALPYSARAFQRLVMGAATDLEMDGSGRILIPGEIRQSCSLTKEVVLVGLGDHFEVWDAAKLAENEAQVLGEDLAAICSDFNF